MEGDGLQIGSLALPPGTPVVTSDGVVRAHQLDGTVVETGIRRTIESW